MADHHLTSSLPQGDAAALGLYDGIDLVSDWFDPNDPIFTALELNASSPPWVVDTNNFNFIDTKNDTCVDPRNLQSIWVDEVTPQLTTPVISPSVQQEQLRTQSYPPLPSSHQHRQSHTAPSPPPPPPLQRRQQPQQEQTHKQREKKQEGGFPCNHNGCGKCFDRACDLRKHHQRTHTPQDQRAWKCPHKGCNKRFIWPKDVNRHRRQVHNEDIATSPSEVETAAATPNNSNNGKGKAQSKHDKALVEPPTKKQRQLLSFLPRKFGTTLLLCRSVVLLKGLRFRRKASQSSGMDEEEGIEEDEVERVSGEDDEDAPGEEDDEDFEPPPSLIHPSTIGTCSTAQSGGGGNEKTSEIYPTATAPNNINNNYTPTLPPQSRYWLWLTFDQTNFTRIEVSDIIAYEPFLLVSRIKATLGLSANEPIALTQWFPSSSSSDYDYDNSNASSPQILPLTLQEFITRAQNLANVGYGLFLHCAVRGELERWRRFQAVVGGGGGEGMGGYVFV